MGVVSSGCTGRKRHGLSMFKFCKSRLVASGTFCGIVVATLIFPARDCFGQGCAPPPAGLLSWWRGEGDALDQAGTNNGTLAGDTTFAPAEVGQGFVFDGSFDGVQVGNAANLRLQDFSIEAWIRRDDTTLVSSISGQDGLILSFGSGRYGFGLSASASHPCLSKIDVDSLTPDS